MKVSGSRCLRIKSLTDRKMEIDGAKELCSRHTKCTGLEIKSNGKLNNRTRDKIVFCDLATYTSTAWDKYQISTNILFRKASNYSKHAAQVEHRA